MTVGDICKRNVVVAPKDEAVVDAAKRMRMFHVGDVIVLDTRGNSRVPIGILTDRDIVLSIVASDPDHLSSLLVADAMSTDLVTTRAETGLAEALTLMQERGVRRLPVVDAEGDLIGIVTFDDVVRVVAAEMGELAKLMAREEELERLYRL